MDVCGYESCSDEDLLAAMYDGAELPFRQLIGRHERSLKRLVWGIVFSRIDTDEVVHDTFVAFWTKYVLKRTRVGNVRTLLFRIARNRAIDVLRRRQAMNWLRLGIHTAERDANPCERYRDGQLQMTLMRAFEKLRRKEREVLILTYVERLKMNEVAEVLSIGDEAVSSRLRRARSRLKDLLPEMYGEEWRETDEIEDFAFFR